MWDSTSTMEFETLNTTVAHDSGLMFKWHFYTIDVTVFCCWILNFVDERAFLRFWQWKRLDPCYWKLQFWRFHRCCFQNIKDAPPKHNRTCFWLLFRSWSLPVSLWVLEEWITLWFSTSFRWLQQAFDLEHMDQDWTWHSSGYRVGPNVLCISIVSRTKVVYQISIFF